ncbi:PREDICTED: adaptin ear-binding coat-associated protein 2, partial [Hipposideros armiger]|uniref:Adaptin ear-binding coat-associated protein 2 n=1 Tax=Hipposideros armiger TaxID=186990 RepID=A0A8B7SAN8_HIPAR
SGSLWQRLNGFYPLRAAEWQLDQPSWSGRLRITAKGQVAYIKLEDRTSGELFAQAPVDQFPGTAVESVTDSSRYFVIRIEDGNGRRAFIGIGFVDRGDAFDFNVALQDHFKWVKQQCEFAKQAQNPDQGPKLDLGFKEGQTIKINIAAAKEPEVWRAPGVAMEEGEYESVLCVKPEVHVYRIPPRATNRGYRVTETTKNRNLTPVFSSYPSDFGTSIGGATVSWPQPNPATTATADIWGDFTKSTGSPSSQTQSGTGWVQF